ncbi:MAG TPA: hypothetical protein ENI33_04785 [Thermoplasmatales archaeon]|nr:hypothetical protein [Thermoplasmatales archaeon]
MDKIVVKPKKGGWGRRQPYGNDDSEKIIKGGEGGQERDIARNRRAEEDGEKVINCGILLIHATTRIGKYEKRH